jgi:hypothetical protein
MTALKLTGGRRSCSNVRIRKTLLVLQLASDDQKPRLSLLPQRQTSEGLGRENALTVGGSYFERVTASVFSRF